jgi:hypothetical protein
MKCIAANGKREARCVMLEWRMQKGLYCCLCILQHLKCGRKEA